MKKTITALFALAAISVAQAADLTAVTFGNATTPTWSDANVGTSGASSTQTTALANGDSIAISKSGGMFWTTDWSTSTLTNESAIKEFGTAIGEAEFSLADVTSLKKYGSGAGTSTLTLTLGINSLKTGDKAIFYALATTNNNSLAALTMSGLSDVTVSYALAGGDGFTDTYSAPAANTPVLFKFEGTVNSTTLSLNSTTNTNGFIAFAYGAAPEEQTPEPATATLSLLALAGLAARRRRK